MPDLDPLDPEGGKDLYLEARKDELTDSTLSAQKYRLQAFVQWCEENGIDNLNVITGRDIYAYRVWRREGNGQDRQPLEKVTLRSQFGTIRAFMRFCGEIEAVQTGLFEKITLPNVTPGEEVSDTTIEPDRMVDILDYLDKYHYASRLHVTVLLIWHTGARIGDVRALDLDDFQLEGKERDGGPALHFVHHPESGTSLKNAEKVERWNGVSEYVARVIQDYIEGPRIETKDDHGRKPLVTTEGGRPASGTLRSSIYRVTRPCWLGKECPHDREIEECDATSIGKAYECPSARSPPDLRSGRVTYYRREDVPRRVVRDRLNASGEILDKHFDRRSEREKAEQRGDYLPEF